MPSSRHGALVQLPATSRKPWVERSLEQAKPGDGSLYSVLVDCRGVERGDGVLARRDVQGVVLRLVWVIQECYFASSLAGPLGTEQLAAYPTPFWWIRCGFLSLRPGSFLFTLKGSNRTCGLGTTRS